MNAKNISAIITTRANRFANLPLPSDSFMKNKGRGSCETIVSTGGIVLIKWFDNKYLNVGYNFISQGKWINVEYGIASKKNTLMLLHRSQ